MATWTIRMSPKGQFTLPKDFRKQAGLLPGDEIILTQIGDEWLLTPKTLSVDEFATWAESLPKPPRALSVEEMDEAIGRAVTEDHEHSLARLKPDAAE